MATAARPQNVGGLPSTVQPQVAKPTRIFIVVDHDEPLLEIDLVQGASTVPMSQTHLHQFVAHAALDVIEEQQIVSGSMFLKVVDAFNDLHVTCWVTASSTKFLLLTNQSQRNDDSAKLFFQGVNELYAKYVMNPFYAKNSKITSTVFVERVLKLGARHF